MVVDAARTAGLGRHREDHLDRPDGRCPAHPLGEVLGYRHSRRGGGRRCARRFRRHRCAARLADRRREQLPGGRCQAAEGSAGLTATAGDQAAGGSAGLMATSGGQAHRPARRPGPGQDVEQCAREPRSARRAPRRVGARQVRAVLPTAPAHRSPRARDARQLPVGRQSRPRAERRARVLALLPARLVGRLLARLPGRLPGRLLARVPARPRGQGRPVPAPAAPLARRRRVPVPLARARAQVPARPLAPLALLARPPPVARLALWARRSAPRAPLPSWPPPSWPAPSSRPSAPRVARRESSRHGGRDGGPCRRRPR